MLGPIGSFTFRLSGAATIMYLSLAARGGAGAVSAFVVPVASRAASRAAPPRASAPAAAAFASLGRVRASARSRRLPMCLRMSSSALPESAELAEIEAAIKTKGDEIRMLKEDGTSKADLAPYVAELLSLKAKIAPAKEEGGGGGKTKEGGGDKKTKGKQKQQQKKGGGGGKQKKGQEQAEMSESELRDIRLGKAETMRDAGYEPYAYTFDATHSASELAALYEDRLEGGEEDEDSDVAVAGRIMLRRVFGKLAFFTLQDESGTVQLHLEKGRLGDSFKDLKVFTDSGDIIGVRGTVRRTDKGELSVYAKEWTMLTKSALPLPDKYHGLTDVSKRYRSRHIDLIVNPDVRDVFRKRALITSSLRRQLDDMGFLEIETPVLQSQPGGAEAKPFETYHNTMDMNLTLRIATELHLKRLIIGGFHRVYEVGRIFRNEGISTRHNPEFTSVELYQAYADYGDMMDLTERLVQGEAALCWLHRTRHGFMPLKKN